MTGCPTVVEEAEFDLPLTDENKMTTIIDNISNQIEAVRKEFFKPKGQNSIHTRKGCGTSKSTYYKNAKEKYELKQAGTNNGANLLEYGFIQSAEDTDEEVLDLEQEEVEIIEEDQEENDDEIDPVGYIPGVHPNYRPRNKFTQTQYREAAEELDNNYKLLSNKTEKKLKILD